MPLDERLRPPADVVPVFGLIIGVNRVRIYAGVATATEADRHRRRRRTDYPRPFGRSLNAETFISSLLGAHRTSAMIGIESCLGASFPDFGDELFRSARATGGN